MNFSMMYPWRINWLFLLITCCSLFIFIEGQQCTEGSVRIVGGPNEFEGRVEICSGGEWGQVCEGGWNNNGAKVVCQQLGYSNRDQGPQGIVGNSYGIGDGPAFIDNVTCAGTENTLLECPHSSMNNSSGCGSVNVAAVVCQDEVCFNDSENVRLVGGGNEGRVEICQTSFFRRGICSTNWDDDDARVVCRELGLLLDDTDPQPTFEDGIRYFGSIFTNFSCNGDELQLRRCQFEHTGSLPRCTLSGVKCQSMQTPLVTSSTISTGTASTRIETEPTTTIMQSSSPRTSPTSSQQPSPTSEAPTEETTRPSAPPSNNTLIIGIGVGVVGGLLLLLFVAVLVVVLVCILGGKRNKKVTFETHETMDLNEYSHHSNNVRTVSVTTVTSDPTHNNTTVYEETQRELLNPIYKPTDHELTVENEVYQPGYADLEEVRPKEVPRILSTDPPTYYSTPTPPIMDKSAASLEYSEPTINVASTDAQGYASLESPHLYDDTQNPLGTAAELDVPSPYETPLTPNINANRAKTQSENGQDTSEENFQEEQHVYEIPTTDIVKEHATTVTNSHPYATLERPS